MTKIVIFCDGTWNHPAMEETTSVRELSLAVVDDPARGQIVEYYPGVGHVKDYNSRLQDFLEKYGGGAFGWGLDANVKQAYKFICDHYTPGDEIYLFGFSRGAFTARSIAGMIRKTGLAADTTPKGINDAFKLYRKRGVLNKPDTRHIRKQRLEISPHFATSKTDQDWRGNGSEIANIAYLGVFDTVGARGIPPALFGPLAQLWNLQYRFHDMVLSRLVKSARHAVAIDERRLFFRPTLWENLPDLNPSDDLADPLRPYQQMWFAGNHGVIGGSVADAQALSVIPHDWILRGAGGLATDEAKMPKLSKADPLIETQGIEHGSGLLKAWRKGPRKGDSIHPSVIDRVTARGDYRPNPVAQFFEKWLR